MFRERGRRALRAPGRDAVPALDPAPLDELVFLPDGEVLPERLGEGVEERGPVVERRAAAEPARREPPADAAGLFEDDDLEAVVHEGPGGDEAGDPRADDEDGLRAFAGTIHDARVPLEPRPFRLHVRRAQDAIAGGRPAGTPPSTGRTAPVTLAPPVHERSGFASFSNTGR